MSKYLLLLMVIVPASVQGACVDNYSKLPYVLQIIETVEKKENRQITDKAIKANEIIISSNIYCLDATLLAAIIAVESGFRQEAINSKSKDYGIAQINEYNIKARKLSKALLVSNLRYGIRAGAIILAEKKRFQLKEPKTWYCRYNVGTAPFHKVKKSCNMYLNKVNSYLIGKT